MEKIESPRRLRRKAKLIELIAEFGGAAQVARESGTPKSHLSAMVSGTRGLGDKLAEKLEGLYGKPTGWFDSATASVSEGVNAQTVQEATVTRGAINLADILPPATASIAHAAINNAALSPDALRLAKWLDEVPDPALKDRAYAECMGIINRRLDEADRNAERAASVAAGTPLEESPDLPVDRQTVRRTGTDRRGR